jgi:hypothetical protein
MSEEIFYKFFCKLKIKPIGDPRRRSDPIGQGNADAYIRLFIWPYNALIVEVNFLGCPECVRGSNPGGSRPLLSVSPKPVSCQRAGLRVPDLPTSVASSAINGCVNRHIMSGKFRSLS